MEKVHSEHVHGASCVNTSRLSGKAFLLGPSQQHRLVVMATISRGSPRHPSDASFGEGAMRRMRGA